MKRSAFLLALTALLALGGAAHAVIGAVDDVPATTLLLPYFEVSTDGSVTTLFSINNASATPAIAHVTLWTNWSVPSIDFNVWLTGYDVVPFNLRDLFLSGVVPSTSNNPLEGAPPFSPVGIFSRPNSVLAGQATCSDQLPLPVIPLQFLAHLQAWHSGQQSPLSGDCASDPTDSYVGYITIDNVTFCTTEFPGTPGYFGTGGAYNVGGNVLWGDYFYVDSLNNFAQGENLVAVETQAGLGLAPGTQYTFYGKFTAGAGFNDDAEALGSTFATRYLNGGAFTGGTSVQVWRDAKIPTSAVTCGFSPTWYPLGQQQIVIFDEMENPDVPQQVPFSGLPDPIGLIPFPNETQSVEVGGPAFPVIFDFGWLYLNLNTTIAGAFINPTMQNHVSNTHDALGAFSVGMDAFNLDNVTNSADSTDIVLPVCSFPVGTNPVACS